MHERHVGAYARHECISVAYSYDVKRPKTVEMLGITCDRSTLTENEVIKLITQQDASSP